MPFTHYPKLAHNIIFAWVQPPPPPKDGFLGQVAFHTLNLFEQPIEPDKSVVAYQDAQNFTRFYGSIVSDQPLEVVFAFANEEVDEDGLPVSDETISTLHYDAEALKQLFEPAKQTQTSRFFVTIFGRWLRVSVKNIGTKPTIQLRVFVRGSVF